MTMSANDRLEILTMAAQAIVLSIGFAFVFSWNTDFQPKALTAMILTLLVLIYPMPDRIKNVFQKDIKELHKGHGITQTMILELRELIPDKIDLEKLSPEEKLLKTQEMAERLETLQSKFDESFEKGFQHERNVSRADQIDFFGNTLAIIAYFALLIGGSALIGWLISLLF